MAHMKNLVFSLRFDGDLSMQVKFFMDLGHIIVKIAMMRNFEIISSNFNAYRICTYEVNSSQK
jgi:hypothetical protein